MKKRYIYIGLAVLLVTILAIFFFSRRASGWLEVTIPNDTPDKAVANIVIETDKGPQNHELQPGETKKIRVKPGLVTVRGSAGNLKAIDVVEVKKSETAKLTTPLGQQHKVSLLGKEARFCPLLIGNDTYSYNCRGEGAIYQHVSPNNAVLFGGRLFNSPQQHKNGVLAFSSVNPGEAKLEYTDLSTRVITSVQLPGAIKDLLSTEIPTLVVPDQESNPSRFALLFSLSNKTFVFNDTNDQNPVSIQPANNIALNEKGRITNGSFYRDHFLLYLGADSEIGEGSDKDVAAIKGQPTPPAAFLFEYAADGSLVNTLDLPDNFFAEDMQKLSDNYYIANWANGSLVYFYQNGVLNTIYDPGNVVKWATYNDKIYLQEESSLYEFIPAGNGLFGLHTIFSSPDLRLSRIFTSPKGVLFTAFVTTLDSQPLNIYLVSDELAQPGESLPGVAAPTTIQFEGTDGLLAYGVTTEQVDALKIAFQNYVQSAGKTVSSISISNILPVSRDRFSTSMANTINFNATVGTELFQAKMEYVDLYSSRLLLYKADGNQLVYDSGMVTAE